MNRVPVLVAFLLAQFAIAQELHSIIHPGVPEYTFKPVFDTEGFVKEIEVYRGASGQPVQRLNECEADEPPPESTQWIKTDDLNFDGFRDLLLRRFAGATGNLGYCLWLFEPKSNRFEYVRDFILENYSLHPANKTLTMGSNGGLAGMVHDKSTLRFEAGRPVTLSREHQGWDAVKCGFRTEWFERAGGKLTLVKQKFTPAEPGMDCQPATGGKPAK